MKNKDKHVYILSFYLNEFTTDKIINGEKNQNNVSSRCVKELTGKQNEGIFWSEVMFYILTWSWNMQAYAFVRAINGTLSIFHFIVYKFYLYKVEVSNQNGV